MRYTISVYALSDAAPELLERRHGYLEEMGKKQDTSLSKTEPLPCEAQPTAPFLIFDTFPVLSYPILT